MPQDMRDQHLNRSGLHHADKLLAVRQRGSNGLLTEHMLPVGHAVLQNRQVGTGVCRNKDNIDAVILQKAAIIRTVFLRAEAACSGFGPASSQVSTTPITRRLSL